MLLIRAVAAAGGLDVSSPVDRDDIALVRVSTGTTTRGGGVRATGMTAAVRLFWPSRCVDVDSLPVCVTRRGLGGMGGGGGMSLLASLDAIIEFDVIFIGVAQLLRSHYVGILSTFLFRKKG